VEKDPTTVVPVVQGLIRCWPWSSSSKQITLLNELEEVLELAGPEAVQPILRPLFRTLARCVGSTHFQVAERSLFLWNNEHLLAHGILSRAHAGEVLPLLFTSLQRNASGHWNTNVETLAQNVLKHYMDADPACYERCVAAASSEPGEKAAAEAARRAKWDSVTRQAAAAAAAGTSSESYRAPVAAIIAATAARGGAGTSSSPSSGALPASTAAAAAAAGGAAAVALPARTNPGGYSGTIGGAGTGGTVGTAALASTAGTAAAAGGITR